MPTPDLSHLKLRLKTSATDNLGEAFQQLKRVLRSDDQDIQNAFLQQLSRYKEAEKMYMQGAMERKEYLAELAPVRLGFFHLVDMLEASHLNPSADLDDDIYTRILVLSRDEQGTAEMQQFFDRGYFKNVRFSPGDPDLIIRDGLVDRSEYDFIVFNLFGEPAEPKREETSGKWSPEGSRHRDLLLRYLKETEAYLVVYYGGYLNELNEFRTRAHAGNSPFALHARIREMMDYLKYHPKG